MKMRVAWQYITAAEQFVRPLLSCDAYKEISLSPETIYQGNLTKERRSTILSSPRALENSNLTNAKYKNLTSQP